MTRKYGEGPGGALEYWNASMGRFRHKDRDGDWHDYESCEGVITGVKLRDDDSEKYGRSTVLQIRMEGTEDDGTNKTIILCFRLVYGPKMLDVTTHGRMVLERLYNPANQIAPGVQVRISAYGGTDNEKVTLIKVQHADDNPSGPGLAKLDHEMDAVKLRSQVTGWAQELIRLFGTWQGKDEEAGASMDESNGHTYGNVADARAAMTGPPLGNAQAAGGGNRKLEMLGLVSNYEIIYGMSAGKDKQWLNPSPVAGHGGKPLNSFYDSTTISELADYLEKNHVLADLVPILHQLELPF